MTRLNIQWSIDSWTADCPHCGASQVFKEGTPLYTCPRCQVAITQSQLWQYIAVADWFNHMGIRNQILRYAKDGYAEHGRGVLVLDVRNWPNGSPQSKYLPAALAESTIGWPAENIANLVHTYVPAYEAVVYIMNNDGSLDDWQHLWAGQPLRIESLLKKGDSQ